MLNDVDNNKVAEENFLSYVKDTVMGKFRRRSYSNGYSDRRLAFRYHRRQSESIILEKQKEELNQSVYRDTLHSMTESIDSTNSKHFLMGGIVTSPHVPRVRNTYIPLSMHENDYKAMLKKKQYQWSMSSFHRRDTTASHDSIPVYQTNGEHMCPYINGADICSKCAAERKRQTFLEKLGKLFVIYEYDSEEERITVVISQYGNINILGHKGKKKPKLNIYIKVVFDDGQYKLVKKKLDFCHSTTEFKFNYLAYFDCESHEMSKRAKLDIKLKYYKAFYRCQNVVKRLVMDLKNIDDNPEDSTEYLI